MIEFADLDCKKCIFRQGAECRRYPDPLHFRTIGDSGCGEGRWVMTLPNGENTTLRWTEYWGLRGDKIEDWEDEEAQGVYFEDTELFDPHADHTKPLPQIDRRS